MADPKQTKAAAPAASTTTTAPASAKKPTPTDRLIEAHQAHVNDLDRQLGDRDQTIKALSAERDNLTRQVATSGRRGRGWILWIIILILLAAVIASVLWGLRLQADCFTWNNFGRDQSICFTAEGLKFLEEVPIPSPSTEGEEEILGDDEAIKPSSSDEGEGGTISDEPATIIPVNGDGKPPVVTPFVCRVRLVDDLVRYFEYRGWDKSHALIIEKTLDGYDPAEATPPIDYRDYEFWGDDGPNLRAFVRDQRFGEVEDGTVIEVTKSTATTRIRYTIFRCECGITAIYREIKVVVVRKPPPKKPGRPIGVIPHMVCPDETTCL